VTMVMVASLGKLQIISLAEKARAFLDQAGESETTGRCLVIRQSLDVCEAQQFFICGDKR
jgi:hypothetical protein